MRQSVLAAVAYFAIVFAVGFVLGATRIIVAAPLFGETPAVLIELPLMLAVSWFACCYLVWRIGVAADVALRLVMGVLALALLMTGELAVSVFGFHRTVAQHFAALSSIPGFIGLLGQTAIAFFPVLELQFRNI